MQAVDLTKLPENLTVTGIRLQGKQAGHTLCILLHTDKGRGWTSGVMVDGTTVRAWSKTQAGAYRSAVKAARKAGWEGPL